MIDLVELKKLCDEYDKENGMYPESGYEGACVYDFIAERITRNNINSTSSPKAITIFGDFKM